MRFIDGRRRQYPCENSCSACCDNCPCKHETFTQFWINAEPASETLASIEPAVGDSLLSAGGNCTIYSPMSESIHLSPAILSRPPSALENVDLTWY